MDFAKTLADKGVLRLDGGFGTLLQARGLLPGESPDDWNVDHPDDVSAIHAEYYAAGSDIVYANTFGSNPLKYHGKHDLGEVIRAAIGCARRAAASAPGDPSGRMVAMDIGPTGKLLEPVGDLSFEAAYEAFAESVRLGAAAGADLVAVETMSDMYELKAAVLAAKENCSLPVIATVALGEGGKLLTGGSVEAVAAMLEGLGADAIGFNCGLGPDMMLPHLERLAASTGLPLVVKPNAGMPKVVDGKTVFTVGPEEFAGHVSRLAAAGAVVIGGCCGTTPAHIAALSGVAARPRAAPPRRCVVSCGTDAVEIPLRTAGSDGSGGVLIIGERINPTGKKKLKAALLAGDTGYVLGEAVSQVEAGAKVLDVNVGVPGLDEVQALTATVRAVEGVAGVPVQLDSSSPEALALAMRRVNGKPLVNSVNGKEETMRAVFPLVRKYGGALVALCLDESGIPPTAEGRVAIAEKMLKRGSEYGLSKDDFLVDPLCLAVSAQSDAAMVTLESIRRLAAMGVRTVLGVSNVSFGLPDRPELNAAFLTLAGDAGLSAAIYNPLAKRLSRDPAAVAVLEGRDRNCEAWVARCAAQTAVAAPAAPERPAAASAGGALFAAIRRGLKQEAAKQAGELLDSGKLPVEVIDGEIVPALEEVGKGFEQGRVYLPQLLMSAEAASGAFEVVKRRLAENAKEGETAEERPPIVIATVKGDIHDIGKNIVRALLENYGFRVVDLGRDVPPEAIVEAARAHHAPLVGLSALMTTTVCFMEETIRQLKASGLPVKTVVGGAVLTADYAERIGADFYAKDAMCTVRIAERIYGGR